ncbi:LuxR C-terminal-related transcriptional regulator [Loktanella sp. TSTF-M6]|uniref:LuxR C-terminal-related transcriptional regulator n=1 Tax=Loktanella gaetbuli TaxID=2881335 RepID=A0ABS8BTQ1_9RHOB|nr:LuxR C-terminal-related transcriptional regulator [Loktanella gaetbuli]MCB5199108.1 LuxR C-terminal-related transcriptional regulator [Loktanella gaetbuli]
MKQVLKPNSRSRRVLFLGAAVLQLVCLGLFTIDILSEMSSPDFHTLVETLSVLGLCLSIAVTFREYLHLINRNRRIERELGAATGAFSQMMQENFAQWGLSPAERDVALMSVKGLSVSEIATLRETANGTVKAQCTAIYRKAGVSNRAELISVMIEDLIAGVPLPGQTHQSSST